MMNELIRLSEKNKLSVDDLNKSPLVELFTSLKNLLHLSNARQILFHAISGTNAIPQCQCGNQLPWHSDLRKYRTYCSKKCTALFTTALKKENNRLRYGVDWHSQLPSWHNKVQKTSIERFGIDHYSKTTDHRSRTIESNRKKFNVDYPSQSTEIQNKAKATCVERYGVDNPSKFPTFNNKVKKTCLEKYKVDNVAQAHYSSEAMRFLSDDVFFTEQYEQFSVRSLAKQYNISVKPIYGKINKLGLPFREHTSSFEADVVAYIESIYQDKIIKNDWSICNNKQLDILLPEMKLAFECNGTYWHSETQGRGKDYHIGKTNQCAKKGIILVHIWEHDWYQKNAIIKSIISNKLKKNQNKINARDTRVSVISNEDAREFFNKNHLQGQFYQKAINLGLYHGKELLSVMSFGKSRFNVNYQWELLRFATKVNHTVVGGASKLFTFFVKNYNPSTVISFADKMHSTGNLYLVLGFQLMSTSKPGYKYTKNFVDVFNRQKFQKHKLKKMFPDIDMSLSEAKIMLNKGYHKLWDCGNDVYVWKTK